MGHVIFLLGCAVVGVEAFLMRAPSLSLTELPLSAPHYLETPIARCLPWCCGAERSLARAALVKGRLRARPESTTPFTARAPSRAAAQRSRGPGRAAAAARRILRATATLRRLGS